MNDRHRDLPDPREPDGKAKLTRREQETAGQLRLLDIHLAGLYERGTLLTREIEEEGVAYIVAFIGRELSRGVLRRVLEDEGLTISDEDLDKVPEEGNRGSIAKALQLSPDDPRVDDWCRLPRLFASWEKYRDGGPPTAAVRTAFERLGSLLYGRVAPYYATEEELDAFLAVEAPTAEHARQLRDLQLRRGQRFHFFGQLKNSAWITHLTNEGFFRNPPGRQVYADGSWRATAWPEGNYLVQAASQAPVAVTRVLESVPLTNDNPAVWDVVAKAASKLPAHLAVGLLSGIKNALVNMTTDSISASIVDLVVALSKAGRAESFDIASYLLYVVDANDVAELEGLRYSSRTSWVFPRFRWHHHNMFLERLVSALEEVEATRTLQFLLSKVHRVQQLADELDFVMWWPPNDLDADGPPDPEDVAARIVASAVRLARRLAERRDEVDRLIEMIRQYDGEVFERISLVVLTEGGQHVPGRLDEVLQSEEARNPGTRAPELAALLRAQFRNASTEARSEYAEALQAGVDRDTIRQNLIRLTGEQPTNEEIEEIVRHVQVRLLRFFRGDIPEELHNLAAKLGVLGVKPTRHQQLLAEVGSYAEPGVGGGDEAPVSVEQLSEWTVEEIVEFVREWKPRNGTAPTLGVQASLWIYARENPGEAIAVLKQATESDVDPGALEGIVNGLGEAASEGTWSDWAEALDGVRRIMRRVTALDPGASNVSQWRRTAGRGARMIEEGCNKDAIPPNLAAEVWNILDEASIAPAVWRGTGGYQPDESLALVFAAAANDASGHIANAVISAALWHYRSRVRVEGESSDAMRAAARAEVRRPFTTILERWLQDGGPHSGVPQAVIGGRLPYLHLLVPEWIEANATKLFEGGLENPISRPTWTAYISRSLLYETVFRTSRTWYTRAAEQASVWRSTAGNAAGTREVTQRLAVHLVIAFLREMLLVGDEDKLLETAYTNLSPSDWDHAYWTIFRSWSDAEEPIPDALVGRLVDLWNWRISELEQSPDANDTVDEAKALGWLFHAPYISHPDRIRLGQATARLAKGQIEMYSRWDRMLALAKTDVEGTFTIAEAVLLAQLRAEFFHEAIDDIRPFVSHALTAGSRETKERARRLINRFGERGFRRLKDLLEMGHRQDAEYNLTAEP